MGRKLREVQRERGLSDPRHLDVLTDREIVLAYVTCSTCGATPEWAEDLESTVARFETAGEFLAAVNAFLCWHAWQGHESPDDSADEEGEVFSLADAAEVVGQAVAEALPEMDADELLQMTQVWYDPDARLAVGPDGDQYIVVPA